MTALLGIFVGGKARRMGGHAKGLLPAPESGEPLVVRLARLARELECEPVLVGAAERYASALPSLRVLADDPADIGPLGGLSALLAAAGDRPALALACDLPYVSRALLARLLQEDGDAAVLAPRSTNGLWEPLAARYHAERVRPELARAIAAGTRSFQALFAKLDVRELALPERAELSDWDRPEDLPAELAARLGLRL